MAATTEATYTEQDLRDVLEYCTEAPFLRIGEDRVAEALAGEYWMLDSEAYWQGYVEQYGPADRATLVQQRDAQLVLMRASYQRGKELHQRFHLRSSDRWNDGTGHCYPHPEPAVAVWSGHRATTPTYRWYWLEPRKE